MFGKAKENAMSWECHRISIFYSGILDITEIYKTGKLTVIFKPPSGGFSAVILPF